MDSLFFIVPSARPSSFSTVGKRVSGKVISADVGGLAPKNQTLTVTDLADSGIGPAGCLLQPF